MSLQARQGRNAKCRLPGHNRYFFIRFHPASFRDPFHRKYDRVNPVTVNANPRLNPGFLILRGYLDDLSRDDMTGLLFQFLETQGCLGRLGINRSKGEKSADQGNKYSA